jgi:low affinity Fe/Cu permease
VPKNTDAHTHRKALPERLAEIATYFAGSTAASALAVGAVLGWALVGPLFGYSENWQLVINTGTTIVTFLMVFLIQRSQNKDSLAVHLKLNEIVAALGGASNRLVTAEDLPERDLAILHRHYCELARRVCAEDPRGVHSVDEWRSSTARRRRRRLAQTSRAARTRRREP